MSLRPGLARHPVAFPTLLPVKPPTKTPRSARWIRFLCTRDDIFDTDRHEGENMKHGCQSVINEVRCPSCGKRNRVPGAAGGVPQCGACHSALPWLVEADDSSFDAIAVHSPLPALIDLWAPWCGPCRLVAPAVEHLSLEKAGQLKVVKVNVDIAQKTAARYQAQSIPTLLILSEGQVVDRIVGALPEDDLRRRVDAVLGIGTS
jgi:thioredoxin 2